MNGNHIGMPKQASSDAIIKPIIVRPVPAKPIQRHAMISTLLTISEYFCGRFLRQVMGQLPCPENHTTDDLVNI